MKTFMSPQPEMGEQKAIIISVEEKANQFYKSEEPEGERNCPFNLTFIFQFANGSQMYKNFVSPVSYGFFKQVCNIAGIEINGQDINPKEFEGLECIATVGEDKKGYLTVSSVKKN